MGKYSIDEIKKTVCEIASMYGVDRIYLFGSYANRNADENSDIDLRVDKGNAKGLSLRGMLLDLEKRFSVNIDLITTGSLSDTFLESIKNEEVLLYEAS